MSGARQRVADAIGSVPHTFRRPDGKRSIGPRASRLRIRFPDDGERILQELDAIEALRSTPEAEIVAVLNPSSGRWLPVEDTAPAEEVAS